MADDQLTREGGETTVRPSVEENDWNRLRVIGSPVAPPFFALALDPIAPIWSQKRPHFPSISLPIQKKIYLYLLIAFTREDEYKSSSTPIFLHACFVVFLSPAKHLSC